MRDRWLPTESGILSQRNEFDAAFGASYVIRIILVANSNDMNVIDDAFFDELYRLHHTLTSETIMVNGSAYNFSDLCLSVTLGSKPGCFQFNPLAYW